MFVRKQLTGAGGGGKAGSGGNSPNSLRSGATVRILDLLGEGEIKGLVDGDKSVFFDNTPLKDSNGDFNFEGISWKLREGLPDQPYIPGFSNVESEEVVNVEVKYANAVTRNISGEDLDAVRVTVTIPALTKQKKKGGLVKNSVEFRLEVKYDGGNWVDPFGVIKISGKNTSPYDKSYYIELPKNPNGLSSPWSVRMTRITEDSDDAAKNQNSTVFGSMTKITFGKFSYPYSAYVGLTVSAEQFGQNVPVRSYEVYGRIIQVPSNYNPETRTYTGIWNGTFKWAWTDNPAWVLYDILTDDRFGLGDYISLAQVDKWSLYAIAQYCDEKIPTGKFAEDGSPILGPRFTFNAWISSQEEAFDAVQTMASCFRGMAYWSSGSVMATQDRPADVEILANQTNVVDGSFSYQGSGLKARHTVCIVKWYNPENNYEQDYVVVEDSDGIELYGYRETEIDATGCTDRAQAYRLGEWTLFTELNETQIVSYTAGLDHAGLRPGDIIAVKDPNISGSGDEGGRLSLGGLASVTLDRPFTFVAGKQYTISIVLPNGRVQERNINVSAYGVPTTAVNVTPNFDVAPEAEAVWVIASNTVVPSLWKAISLREASLNTFEVVATQHEPAKFAHIDYSARFDPLPVTGNNAIQPPTNLVVTENIYSEDGVPRSGLLLSWTSPGIESAVTAYNVSYDGPDGFVNLGRVASTSITLTDTGPGEYTMYVQSIGFNRRVSRVASVSFASEGWEGAATGEVKNLRLKGKTTTVTTFTGSTAEFVWDNVWTNLELDAGENNPVYLDNVVNVYDTATNTLLRTENVLVSRYSYTLAKNREDNAAVGRGPSRAFRVEVAVRDVYSRTSAYVSKAVSNPAPAVVGPQALPGFGQFVVRWDASQEPDLAGYLVWVSTVSGFNPLTTQPYTDGRINAVIYSAAANTTYYVRVAAYDDFGKTGLNISGQIEATGVGSVDFEAPAVPTGLAATSTLTADGRAKVRFTWTANTETDLAGYDLQIKEGTGNFITFGTSDASYEVTVPPGTALTAQVRAYDRSVNRSAYSAPISHTAAKDTIPPAIPTGLAATGTFNGIWLQWTENTEADFMEYEIYEGTAATPVPVAATVATFKTLSAQLVRNNIPPATARWYWVRALDTSGNKSNWSALATASTLNIDGSVPAPAVPTALAASSTLQIDAQGNVRAKVRVTWTAPTGASLYDVGIVEAGGNERFDTVAPNSYEFLGLPGIQYTIRVRSIGAVNNKSAYTAVINFTPGGDTSAPAKPLGLTATAGIDAIWLKWTPNSDNDLKHYEILEGDTNVFSAAVVIGRTAANNAARAGLTLNTQKFYWVRAVDTSGNVGVQSDAVSATTGSLPSANKTTIRDVLFTPNYQAVNRLGWSAGIAYWGAAGGTVSSANLTAGSVDWASGTTVYICYKEGDTSLTATTSITVAYGVGTTIIGIYKGGTDFQLIDGKALTDGSTIIAGTIGASQLVATSAVITGTIQIADAVVSSAKIISLDAGKIQANTVLSNTITVNGSTLGVIKGNADLGAQDPATRINSATTQIDPGKITISGATTLSDWRGTTDTTKIFGGSIETNSITARSIQITDFVSLIQNWDFADMSAETMNALWTFSGGPYSDAGTAGGVPGFWRYQSGAQTNRNQLVIDQIDASASISMYMTSKDMIPVTGGEVLAWEVQGRTNGVAVAAGFYVRFYWYDGAGAAITPGTTDVVNNKGLPAQYGDAQKGQVTVPDAARSFRLRIYNSTGNTTSRYFIFDRIAIRRANAASLVVDGSIKANHINVADLVVNGLANITTAYIVEANITGTLSAAKLTAGTALAASVTVSGRALSAINTDASLGAQNPATRINSGTTQIDPGRILISGSTTLASWRDGTDSTSIAGGRIAANTITANKLEIGARGITIEGIRFSYNKANGNVSWTAGRIYYTRVDGSASGDPDGYVNVSAGNSDWASGTLFIYWAKPAADPANGATVALSVSTSAATANGTNTLVLATYKGGINFVANYGQTIIDGTTIYTGSIETAQIKADAITAALIKAGEINGSHIAANTITAKHLIIGDATNLVPDATMVEASVWSVFGPNNAYFIDFGTGNGGRAVRVASSANPASDSTQLGGGYTARWPVIPSQKYALGVNIDPSSVSTYVGTANCRIYWYKQDGSASAITSWQTVGNKDITNNTDTRYDTILTAPTDACFAAFRFCRYTDTNGQTTADGNMNWHSFTCIKAVGTVMIEDGAINAGKITITSGGLAAITDGDLGTINKGAFNINNRFIVASDGATTIRSGTSGARMQITPTRIEIYDENGTLRVRLGQL